ncbi:protein ENHANCED DISEASE RESISTANCE 4-like isoform X2 [Cucurbita maxima]|uniref:Protein ENHANCED DISEASE RESISTANCE 4-like isoform X2 n=1 Tax=Cucurbita maxima TaxID=3661 RepID=A0A6J1JXB7_CUCMA|nr:protein ENHANCED DISEASE RESISTANCE 4-like isoform X2 [Cucurbita maxima]
MATGLTAKIRLVKCPRCHRLLPELPDIPVYKCGGCDAILVAKSRRESSHDTELGSQNRDSAQRREVGPLSVERQPSISNHEAIIPPHDESTSGLNNDRDANESGERSNEELVHSSLSVQRNARNDDGSHHENGELSDGDLLKVEVASISSSSPEAIISSSGEYVVDPDVEEVQDKSGDSCREQLVHKKLDERQSYAGNNNESRAGNGKPSGFSNQVYYEEECTYHENSISSHEATIPSSGKCFIDPNDAKDRKESAGEQLAHIKSSECLKNARSNGESQACHDEQLSCSNQSYSRIEFASHGNDELSGPDPTKAMETSTSSHEVITVPFSGESVLDQNDDKDQKEEEDNHSEQLVQVSLNEGVNRENDKLSSRDPSEDERLDEILLSGEGSPEADDRKEIHSNLETSEAPEETISHDFDHHIPVENFGCMEVNRCSEPSGALPGMVKSLTTKSYFAYDGMDDRFSDRHRRSLKNTHEAVNFLSTVEGPRRQESLMKNNAVVRDSDIPIEAGSSQEILPHEKHYDIAYLERNQNDMLQHRRHGISMQSRSRLRREKYQSKSSLLRSNLEGDRENGSASNSTINGPHDSRMHSSENFVDPDEEKVRLLRMVYELQDQLEKSCNLNTNTGGRVSTGSVQKDTWAPMYNNQQISQEESWHESEHPYYFRRSGPQTNYPGQHSLSRMTSAAKAVSGPQNNCFSMEQFPDNIPPLMQRRSSEVWHNRGARMAHMDHDYYSQYNSCASSPQHFHCTQLPARGIQMQSDQSSHGNLEMNYLREKRHLAKHHLRPMAGGAPFITCYHCLKLLQIPAEFLLVKRPCNRLKCGHCSKVLEFSLWNRTHIVPYIQNVAEPPPYEAEEHNDYALTIGNRGSREIDDSIVLPHSSHRGMEKELSSKWSSNKFESLKKSYQSGDPSSKVGKLSTESVSPLHRLMGYSSPSQVFRGLDASRRSMQREY